MDDLLLPGAILEPLRRCSPIVVTRGRYAGRSGTVVDAPDGCPRVLALLGTRGGVGFDQAILEVSDIALDLTDATGRAHAAWGLAGEPGVSWGLDCDGHRRWELRGGERPWFVVCRAWEGIGPEARSLRGEPVPDYADAADCPALDDLDPNDDRRLPDGSRWVDAVALARVCRHVAGERAAA